MGLVVYCHLNGTEDEVGNVVARVVLTADMEGKRVLAVESKKLSSWGTGGYTLLRAYDYALATIHKMQTELMDKEITDVCLVYHNKNLFKWVIEEKGGKEFVELVRKIHSKYCVGGTQEIFLHLSLASPEMESVAGNVSKEEHSEINKQIQFKEITLM